jgi:hypothetical protein
MRLSDSERVWIIDAVIAASFKAEGKGPTARAKSDEILELDRKVSSREGIANQLGIGIASVYRVLKSARMAA